MANCPTLVGRCFGHGFSANLSRSCKKDKRWAVQACECKEINVQSSAQRSIFRALLTVLGSFLRAKLHSATYVELNSVDDIDGLCGRLPSLHCPSASRQIVVVLFVEAPEGV